MKKSQILAALALAFALGVVAPVAGAANALTHDDTTTAVNEGSATLKEVETAVEAVEADTTYNNMANLKAQIAKLTAVAPATTPEYQEAGRGLIDNITYYWTDSSVNTNAIANTEMANDVITADLAGTAATPANIQKAIDIAEKTAGYAQYSNLIDAIEKKSGIGDAIFALNQYLYGNNVAAYFPYNATAVAQYVSTTNNPVNSDSGIGATYKWFLGLSTAVKSSQTAVNSYNTGLTNLKNAIFAAGVLSDRDAETLENSLTANPYPTLASLAGFANSNAQDYNLWQAVMTAVDNAKKATARTAADTNYGYIIALARAYGNATNEIKALTAEQIADKLVGYVKPAEDNKPEDNDNNGDTDTDTEKDPSAPGTGVISSADGNAATTVSIVAGLATALTAFGAGVVAYRSARRSSEK